MYVVFVTHRDDLKMAFYVVKVCAPPMIIFTGIGLALCANALKIYVGEWKNPFKRRKDSEIQVAQKFQRWLFLVSAIIIVVSFAFSFAVQTASAVQNTTERLATASADIIETYNEVREKNYNINVLHSHVGETGDFNIIRESGLSITGGHKGDHLSDPELAALQTNVDKGMYRATAYGVDSFCRADTLANGEILLVSLPSEEVYDDRDAASYETALADIILFTVIYVLISMLVQEIVVNNLDLVNESLNKITNGDLNETVDVYNSSEFASLSDDINQTVNVLKGYIDAAEKRIAQELEFAKSIQESALPQNFHIPRKDVEIFATMDPAKEVGGDFYDFFFIDADNMALVIADVSGKGIPASLFMMRSKAAIRSTAVQGSNPSDILEKVNEVLCEGNDADMFVTVWIGIMNLKTGVMRCSNAGHEYPIIRHKDGDYELLKDKHFLALATIEGIKFKDYEIDLKYGDEIFVYTDGIPEAIDKDIKQYGTERLLSALNANKDIPLDRLLPRVRNDLAQFVGEADQFDDVTMLGFKYKDPVA
ncbi:PP2C family protein-serine/threonine phosphatase [Butyrivibrio sp. VCB2001]|uniref:PP2C family protein-serine/threonine phosphatase n=1 Tax=Butyrivibrio sp. VCB2001 TaxID=1280667 RepID=UPI0004051665|nr:SpoIIE family protein phosphatase [Butyrivibrio sp. VCB2001]